MSLQQRNQHVVEAYEKFNISQWGKGADRVSICFLLNYTHNSQPSNYKHCIYLHKS